LLGLLCLTQFMLVVDGTITTVALPTIGRDLHIGPGSLQWLVTVYGLSFGGFLMIGGRGADMFGRRRFMVGGLSLFVLSSMLCALAQSESTLIGARALQGLGAAMVSPSILSLLTATFAEGHARNRALGIWGAAGAAGATSGNVLGGILTSLAGWRWIFLVNVPIGVAVLLATLVLVPRTPRGPRQRLDLLGAVTVTAGLALLIYASSEIGGKGLRSSAAWPWLLAAVALLALFVVIERRVEDPLLRLSLLRRRGAVGNLLGMVAATCVIGPYFFISLFMQRSMGLSPIVTGFAFAPWAATIALGATLASRSARRFGVRRLTIIGFAVTALGITGLARISPTTTYAADLLPAFLLMGIGGGTATVCSTITAMSGIAPEEHGVGAALMNTSQRVGGAVGLGLLSAVSTSHASSLVDAGTSLSSATIAGYRLALYIALALGLSAAALAAVFLREPAQAALEAVDVSVEA
jgi:EmrB/QacA subfamily drug resistance transporter